MIFRVGGARRGCRHEMQDKEQCVYNLNRRPLCLPIRLTSYTSLLEQRTFPLLTLLALRVCGLTYVNEHTGLKKSVLALSAALWALHQSENLIRAHLFLCSLSSFMGYEVVHVRACVCLCRGDLHKRQDVMCGRGSVRVIQIAHKSKTNFICQGKSIILYFGDHLYSQVLWNLYVCIFVCV